MIKGPYHIGDFGRGIYENLLFREKRIRMDEMGRNGDEKKRMWNQVAHTQCTFAEIPAIHRRVRTIRENA